MQGRNCQDRLVACTLHTYLDPLDFCYISVFDTGIVVVKLPPSLEVATVQFIHRCFYHLVMCWSVDFLHMMFWIVSCLFSDHGILLIPTINSTSLVPAGAAMHLIHSRIWEQCGLIVQKNSELWVWFFSRPITLLLFVACLVCSSATHDSLDVVRNGEQSLGSKLQSSELWL